MAASGGKATNIKIVEFDITLDNLKEFNEYWTEKFFIRGNPWAIRFGKIDSHEGYPKKSSLAGYLHSKIDTSLKDWVIIANFTMEIYSNKYNGKSVLKEFPPCYFFKPGGLGNNKLISWNELMDPRKGYVYNGMCKIGIKVEASPLQFPNDGKMLELVPALKCCDASPRGEFRIKINEAYDFFDICSPEFTLKHFPWRLLVCKNVTSKNNEKEEFLQVRLYNLSLVAKTKVSCKVTLLCKLIPFETTIEPISKKLKNEEINYCVPECFSDLISWKELMNPQKKFIQNNTFVLEITIEVTEATEQEIARTLKRKTMDEDNEGFIRLECPICFKWLISQPLSVLMCGHMYCSACVSRTLEQKKNCPLCLTEIKETKLQQVFMPAK